MGVAGALSYDPSLWCYVSKSIIVLISARSRARGPADSRSRADRCGAMNESRTFSFVQHFFRARSLILHRRSHARYGAFSPNATLFYIDDLRVQLQGLG